MYDLMYRYWAPWDAAGVRSDLVGLLDSGRVDPERFPATIDLGCGTGANAVILAEQGYDATGVDFSAVAAEKARARADEANVDCRFLEVDLTGEVSYLGTFDLLTDFGTLDDLQGEARVAMANSFTKLARPGAVLMLFCFYGARDDLPWLSFSGPSRLYPGLVPGEVEDLFAEHWTIEEWSSHPDRFHATYLMTRGG